MKKLASSLEIRRLVNYSIRKKFECLFLRNKSLVELTIQLVDYAICKKFECLFPNNRSLIKLTIHKVQMFVLKNRRLIKLVNQIIYKLLPTS